MLVYQPKHELSAQTKLRNCLLWSHNKGLWEFLFRRSKSRVWVLCNLSEQIASLTGLSSPKNFPRNLTTEEVHSYPQAKRQLHVKRHERRVTTPWTRGKKSVQATKLYCTIEFCRWLTVGVHSTERILAYLWFTILVRFLNSGQSAR